MLVQEYLIKEFPESHVNKQRIMVNEQRGSINLVSGELWIANKKSAENTLLMTFYIGKTYIREALFKHIHYRRSETD